MAITTVISLFAALVPAASQKPITVKVLVLNFDPILQQEGGKRLHEAFNWTDPHKLADGYAKDLEEASGNFVKCKIVKWQDVNEIPIKKDGFRYTPEQYRIAWQTRKGLHDPDGADYERVCSDYGVNAMIDSGKADELWIFGAPAFGFWESAMAGPGAFYINGDTYPKVPTKKPFAIMGFNYERGIAEMIHDLSHRTESTMARVYGGWQVEKLDTPWAKFAANFAQSGGVAAVGTCHWPPNAEHDYDYGNKRIVQSSADDWLKYPKLTGATKPVNCETWGGPDYHRNYMKWWFSHLPKAAGTDKDGRQLNWWKYVFEFNKYDEKGQPLKK